MTKTLKAAAKAIVARREERTQTVTRARAEASVVAARVDHVAAIMRTGQWVRGGTGIELAVEWGVPLTTVESYASEAWRRVCAEADDATKARPTIAGTLATALAQSAEAREHKTTAQLADVWSRVVGARAPERHEHAVVVAQYDAMPKEAKAAWLEERAAMMLAEATRLRAEEA